jgi:phosphodiesterase/alkaline phosphatase D-like protein
MARFFVGAIILIGAGFLLINYTESGFSIRIPWNHEPLSRTSAHVNEVIFLWSGAIQPTSATVVAKLSYPAEVCRLVISTSRKLRDPMYSLPVKVTAIDNHLARLEAQLLTPGTTYYYAIEADSILDDSDDDIGTFTTPEARPFSYHFTVGSCSGNSNHPVFKLIQDRDPLFHLTTGDFHYANPNSGADINVHRAPYEERILKKKVTASLFREVPIVYVWDDHDYSGDNSDGTAAGKTNARLAYQEYVPHFPLAAGKGDVAIYQAFTIGRVHFVLSDLRSERIAPDIMSPKQKQWFKDQCIYARDNRLMIAWVTGISFGGTTRDNWGGFAHEREELSNFFLDNDIRNMFILSGDAHMVAIDDGTHHDFSSAKANPNRYPVFQSAALNRHGSMKGGGYTEGTFPNPDIDTGQYGVVEIVDDGGNFITVTFKAFRTAGLSEKEKELTSYTFKRKTD